ncbi:MAG TPA: LysM peptidoglycan-binding domain-containing protein [Anaerolineales bacterium]|nr:LysM peptidoglycan-binding domain-containing protein [Anaerolineales bacterium]
MIRPLTGPLAAGLLFALTACTSLGPTLPTPQLSATTSSPIPNNPTAVPTRPFYKPGQLVDYIAQTGDTIPALASHFNTTVAEIMAANPIIPPDATTMPPGLPMQIPIYYRELWGTSYKTIPDNAFVNGPTLIGFNTSAFVAAHAGWLKDYVGYAGGEYRTGAGIVDYVATNYSVSPRLLLALLEFQAGALSRPQQPPKPYILGFDVLYSETVYYQLIIAAQTLNNGYYGWRAGNLIEFERPDKTIVRPDPWLNAASVGIQYYFAQLLYGSNYDRAVGPNGLSKTYRDLFGDPWANNSVLIPGSLKQPSMLLPFARNETWTYTGGPHTGWGSGEPFAAVDFAPPSEFHGCFTVEPQNYAVAATDGLVVRSSIDGLALDLDEDGDERTGWVIFYLHLAGATRAPVGKQLQAGDFIGYPSCQGGEVTGTHVHIARKYNGEWILADGPLAFNLEGWITHAGALAYQGTLTRNGTTVTACQCSDFKSQIKSGAGP